MNGRGFEPDLDFGLLDASFFLQKEVHLHQMFSKNKRKMKWDNFEFNNFTCGKCGE